MRRAVVIFKDGTNDWVDPIESVEDDIRYSEDGFITINNGYYTYEYDTNLVERIDIVEI